MAIIYSYPTVTPSLNDLVLGTDVDNTGKATRNFTVQSIIDLVTVTGNNLQDVLNNGNIAVGRDIILGTIQDPAQTIYANTFNTGVASIVGGVGQNFTDFTSTRITGTLQTSAQPNITSIGVLTSLRVGSATPAITSIVTTLSNPGDNIKLATTKAIVDYIATTPNPETLAQTLQAGNTTGGTDIAVSAADDITLTDTSKIILGTGSDATVEHNGTDLKILNTLGKTTISNSSGDIDISATAATKKLNLNGKAGVELQFETGKRFETLLGGAKVTGAFEATGIGTLNGIVNTNSYTANNGVGSAGQILSSTVTGTNWIDDPNPTPYSWLVEADSGAGSPYTVANGNQIHFKGDTNISTSWNNTNKEVLISLSGTSVTGTGAANQVTYWDGAQTITGAAGLTFAGGATGKVAIGGELEVGGVLTDGTFTGSSGTYTGYASISSTVFVGPLAGNADTATALINAGTVSMSGDAVASGVTYTSGGNVPLVSTISDSVVYNKALAGFNETNGAVANGDSIIEALEKLQGQITNLPQGIVYQGIWDPGTSATSGGTPDLRLAANKVNGHYYIVSTAGIGTPNGNGTTPNDWDVRDWCVFADDGAGGGADEWQKIDNSSLAGGTGTPNTMTKWLTNQTIGNSTITDNGSIVTIADTIDFTTQGNNTFGNTSADTTLMKGNTTLEENLILAKGLSLGSSYGTAGQVLTSGGGVNVANTWTSPTVGTVTSVGYTHQGDAFTVGGVPVTSSGVIAVTMAGTASQYINGAGNLITFPTLDNYQYWVLSDDTTTVNISSTNTAKILGGTGITSIVSAADKSATIAIDITGTDNAIAGLTAATPIATDTLWFNDISDSNTIRKATISDIVDLGNETLAQVLSNGNTTSGTDIAVSAADDITFSDTSKAKFGNSGDLEINHNATPSVNANEIACKTGKPLRITQDNLFIGNEAGDETFISALNGGLVTLHYNGGEKLATTSTGVSVTGALSTSTSASVGTTLTTGGSITVATHGFLSITGGNNLTISGTAVNHSGLIFATQAILPATVSAENNGVVDLGANGNQFKDLYLSGNVIHGGSGTGTKGGQFTKLYTTGNAGVAGIAFTIDRASSGSMVFDVMLTSDNSNSVSIAKKFTVASKLGVQAPIFNKTVDTGPDGSNDFAVAFAADGTSNTKIKCTITPAGMNTQKIGITIDLGFGQNDATVVMN